MALNRSPYFSERNSQLPMPPPGPGTGTGLVGGRPGTGGAACGGGIGAASGIIGRPIAAEQTCWKVTSEPLGQRHIVSPEEIRTGVVPTGH
jgi:hypothetical protein